MRLRTRTPLGLFLVASMVAGCNGTSENTTELEDIPSQEELDAEAAEEIDQENADEAFQALKEEIEAGD